MKQFEICVPCGQNSDYYVSVLLDNMRRTMSDPQDTRVILGINNYPQFDLGVLGQFRDTFDIEHHWVNTVTPPGSHGHALTLSAMLDDMTAPVGAFVDCDICFLTKGWDRVMKDELARPGVEAFGLEYTNRRKYRGFPNLIVCAFRPDFVKSLNVDFTPMLDPPNSEYVVRTQLEADAWGATLGETVVLDCGYQFPLRMCEARAKGTTVPFVGAGVLGVGQEHHWNGKPFLTHLKGSSVQDRNHPRTVQWVNAANRYIQSLGL